MEPENPPTKHPRITQHGIEWRKVINGEGEGCVVQAGFRIGGSPKKSGFTFMQMRELQHQSLIYEYMEAGTPVPFPLIYPIWKSINSLTAFTVIGSSTASLFSNYRNTMEAEPGRCKRTDGKKWRCTKNVVPDHKYCQWHLHRGRGRGRALHHTSTNHLQAVSSSTSTHHQDSTIDISQ